MTKRSDEVSRLLQGGYAAANEHLDDPQYHGLNSPTAAELSKGLMYGFEAMVKSIEELRETLDNRVTIGDYEGARLYGAPQPYEGQAEEPLRPGAYHDLVRKNRDQAERIEGLEQEVNNLLGPETRDEDIEDYQAQATEETERVHGPLSIERLRNRLSATLGEIAEDWAKFMDSPRGQAVQAILTERARQDGVWGAAHDDDHTMGDWRGLVDHYMAEAQRLVNDPPGSEEKVERSRERLLQAAALCLAAIESWDRTEGGEVG